MNKKKKFNPFNNLILDKDEEKTERELEQGYFKRVSNFKKEKKMLEEAAERHIELQETKSITLRVKKKDLIRVKAKAKRNNIPYQTLINLLINNYTEGKSRITV